MKTVSITPATPTKARLQGVALALVIIALMLSLLLEALDQTIVGTAMPRIIAELHGLDRYSWVVTAYVLASMTMVPIVGKLSDQFGRKWFLLGGTALFLVGSLLAGASQTMEDRAALSGALQHGFGAILVFALIALAAAFFLKDVPFVSSSSRPVLSEELANTMGEARAADSISYE